MGLRKFFRCVGEAVCAKGLKALMSLMPFGDAIYDIASETYERLKKETREDERTAAIVQAAQSSLDHARTEAEAAVREIKAAADLPVEAQINLVRYLTQVPAAIRQSLKRPADPTGKTVPPAFAINQPEQLLPMLPSRLPAFKPGDRPAGCGNWELVELLGTGGFGEVWLARHPSLHSIQVALKFCLDASAAAVLRHEAALLNRVMERSRNYQGFVTLRQAYLDAEPPCLEYDYVAGGDLIGLIADWHRARKPPLERINKTMHRLANIVAHAHGMSTPIVHRDLKPANILVDRGEDNKARLRVADFGIGGVAVSQALAQHKGSTSRAHLLATSLRGAHTPHYASPQQARGEAPDPRDDVHALGVIWYQMLTNELGSGVPADWMPVLKDAGQPAGMIELLGKCLASKAENRLANASALATRLAKLIEESKIIDAVEVVEDIPMAKVVEIVAPVIPTHKPVSPTPSTEGRKATPPPLTVRPPLEPPTGRRPPPLPAEPPYERPPAPRVSPRHSNAQVCTYRAPGLRLRELVRELENWFVAEGFTSQVFPTDDGVLMQIAQKSSMRQATGMATALNVSLSLYRDELEVEVGAGNWSDKAAAGVVGMLVLWPLAVTAAIGAYNQSQMPSRIFARISEWLSFWRMSFADAAPPPLAVPAAPAVPTGGLSPEVVAQLKTLAELRAAGALTDEELQARKAKLLG